MTLSTKSNINDYSSQQTNSTENSSPITSTRLLCGTAYYKGFRASLALLSLLKNDPYKGKSPNFDLDINRIVTHASRSVAISVVISLIVITITIFQIRRCWIKV